jgi:hypothetical protein
VVVEEGRDGSEGVDEGEDEGEERKREDEARLICSVM